MASCTVGMRPSEGMSHLLSVLRLTPCLQRVGRPGYERLVGCSAIPPRDEAHVHLGGLAVTGALAVYQELLDDVCQKLHAGLPLMGGDENGATDFLEDGRRALLVRRIDDVCLERIDSLQLVPAAVQSKLAGIVRSVDCHGIRQLDRRKAREERPARTLRQTSETVCRGQKSLCELFVGGTGGVSEDERVIIGTGE